MSEFNSAGHNYNKFGPTSPPRDQVTIDAVNQSRVKAWNQVMFALGTVAIVGIVYMISAITVWTGGLLIAGAWLFNSLRTLRSANKEIVRLEEIYGVALKTEIPTVTKVGVTLALPVALISGVSAINTYDPYLFGSGGSSSSSTTLDDPTVIEETTEPAFTPSEPAVFPEPSTEPYSAAPTTDEPPRIVRTVDLTDAEFADSGFDYALGVDIWVPYSCTDLILYWHTEDDAGNYYYDYSNSYSSLSPGTVNEFYMGTNSPLSDEETYFATDSVECV